MNSPAVASAQATLQLANQRLAGEVAIVVLHLGDDAAAVAWGQAPDQAAALDLGLVLLATRLAPGGRSSAGAVEDAIATVEDVVMPWHGRIPVAARLVSGDVWVQALASWAGMPADADAWWLSTEAVERLFDRWAALVQGRPASQDGLPSTGAFAAALLVLREWLHHLGFDGVWVLGGDTPA